MCCWFNNIPCTALICVQWLQRYSSYKALFLVRKFHPLIDAYTGPYETKHHYWTGLLLLVRVYLFLVFALNPYDDPTPVNLLVIFVTSLSLLTYLSLIKGVYRLHWLNWIENIFLINLSILSATVGLYRHSTDTTISKVSYASTGTAFIFFVIILLYHLFIKLMSYGRVRASWTTIVESFQRFKKVNNEEPEVTECNMNQATVTYSEVGLSQPLIDTD